MTYSLPNHDEDLSFDVAPDEKAYFIGNFHKTLHHNEFGEVEPSGYRKFERTCKAIDAGAPINFEETARGDPALSTWIANPPPRSVAKFVNPMAGAASESLGPDPHDVNMPPPPGILSESTAAEMTELYWMALLRDEPIDQFGASAGVAAAVTEIGQRFSQALANDRTEGGLALVRDLPAMGGLLDLRRETIFRCGLEGEAFGPLVSQFFLRDIPYGAQWVNQSIRPYKAKRDYLTAYADWFRAQETGLDAHGRDYASCNFYADDHNYYAAKERKISTLRDLARFVNRDALHQAYFNAALFLLTINAPLDQGNPYHGARFSREGGFATLGGPDLLTIVSEVASRALKVVWRQKWLVNRRARPEAYGGLVQMQFLGKGGKTRAYGLPAWVIATQAAAGIKAHNGALNAGHVQTYFLPMAYSAGSPAHPAYGAGHATVAGACVTLLKAWFDEGAGLEALLARAQAPGAQKDPVTIEGLLQPGPKTGPDLFGPPAAYTGSDAGQITVGGELNKIASNVAMGRSMGGVHWRSDNTRSLRLGEKVAIEVLRKRTMEYAERPVSFTFRSFDRNMVQISQGEVRTF